MSVNILNLFKSMHVSVGFEPVLVAKLSSFAWRSHDLLAILSHHTGMSCLDWQELCSTRVNYFTQRIKLDTLPAAGVFFDRFQLLLLFQKKKRHKAITLIFVLECLDS